MDSENETTRESLVEAPDDGGDEFDEAFTAAWLAPVHTGVRLHFFGGSRDGSYVEITKPGEFVLGRSTDSNLAFDGKDPVDAMVSARHARLIVAPEAVCLLALRPTNGLYLFDVEIPAGRAAPLYDGDLLRLGRGGPRVGVRIGNIPNLSGSGANDGEKQ